MKTRILAIHPQNESTRKMLNELYRGDLDREDFSGGLVIESREVVHWFGTPESCYFRKIWAEDGILVIYCEFDTNHPELLGLDETIEFANEARLSAVA